MHDDLPEVHIPAAADTLSEITVLFLSNLVKL